MDSTGIINELSQFKFSRAAKFRDFNLATGRKLYQG